MTETEMNEFADMKESELEQSVPSSSRQRVWLIIIASVVIVVDQLSKLIIESTLPLYRSWAPIPSIDSIFRFSHVSNTGTAFGLFPNGSSIFAWAAVLVSIGILAYNYTIPSGEKHLRIALGLQLGGALGNLIDRWRLGHVTDFLDFGPWPVFNLADLAIVSGAILLAVLLWQEERQQKLDESPAPYSETGEQISRIAEDPHTLDEWSTN